LIFDAKIPLDHEFDFMDHSDVEHYCCNLTSMGSKRKKSKVVPADNNHDKTNVQREKVAKETVVEEDPDMADDPNNNSVTATTAKKKRLRKRKVTGAETEGNDNGDEPSNNQDNSTPTNDATLVVASDHEKNAQVNRTLYIEGIPFAAQPDQVRQCMLEHATFLDPTTDIVELRLPTWQDSGRLRGYHQSSLNVWQWWRYYAKDALAKPLSHTPTSPSSQNYDLVFANYCGPEHQYQY
jgi:hypothetical protein